MYTAMIVLILFVTLFGEVCSRRKIRNHQLSIECHKKCPEFNCACEDEDWMLVEPECIPFRWLCDAEHDCLNKADEIDCICPPGQFQCGIDRGGDANTFLHIYNCIDSTVVDVDSLFCESIKDYPEFLRRLPAHSFDSSAFVLSTCNLFTCDGFTDCPDGSDEMNCDSCPPNLPQRCHCNQPNDFKCKQGITCYSDANKCDGWIGCPDGADEEGCTCNDNQFTCDCYKKDPATCSVKHTPSQNSSPFFHAIGCISINWRCDAAVHCGDGSDEWNCTCNDDQFTCDCYKTDPMTCAVFSSGCFAMNQQCDESFDCSDGSDEENCPCREDQFTCGCKSNFCSGKRCIPINKFLDGAKDCDDGGDEPVGYFKRTKCGNCDITVRRLNVAEQCGVYDNCDNATCVFVSALTCTDNFECNTSEVVCLSGCSNMNASQSCTSLLKCENGEIDIADNFCDGKKDCLDGSDEVGNQPGFKCSASFGRCVLPQINLYDDVAQCEDGSDLCSHIPCFECLDRRLIISQTQLCDGIIDCFDLSDECLCDIHFRKPICEERFISNDAYKFQCGRLNPQCSVFTSSSIETAQCRTPFSANKGNAHPLPSHISCQVKSGETRAVTCDGRPECRDFSDECSCGDPPIFCSDHCHDFYSIGDRYCDGIIDEAWKFINNSSCPEGFDEKSCPQRFTCKAGNLVSIDRVQVCDGKVECDDGSDEVNCNKGSREAIFSSQTQMIGSIALRIIFWFMSAVVILGNSAVIVSTIHSLYKEKMSESQKFNYVLMVNLSCSDFLMGIYLLLISTKSVQYSGIYGDFDYQWRTGLGCSIIGSLAVISSETSCFMMTIITAFRLYNVFKPFTARTASTLKWKLAIVLAWSFSLVLALIPVFKATSNYFTHEVWFSNKFTSREGWNKTYVITFACRLASLTNQSINLDEDAWGSTTKYLRYNFPEYSPRGEVGYYGETSICMPRIYASRDDQAWVYSLVVITFNFVSFLFVAIAYSIIYLKVSNRPIQNSRCDKQATQMQRRFARLIATDFACWMPICIMVYLKTGGVEISNLVYIVTAGVLLPINSALNPLLYSPIAEKYFVNISGIRQLRKLKLFCLQEVKVSKDG